MAVECAVQLVSVAWVFTREMIYCPAYSSVVWHESVPRFAPAEALAAMHDGDLSIKIPKITEPESARWQRMSLTKITLNFSASKRGSSPVRLRLKHQMDYLIIIAITVLIFVAVVRSSEVSFRKIVGSPLQSSLRS